MKSQYQAFISYNSHDLKWAKWLQQKLETYKFPKSVIKEHGDKIYEKLRPVFLDKTDMTLGELSATLQNELNASKYLIVICSPYSAKAEWVEKEVHHFVQKGKEKFIIPFIIDGSPKPKDIEENQCYPPSLNTNILGASILEIGKEKALIRIIAKLVGLKFDLLWQRHERRLKKRRKIKHSLLTILFLSVSAGGLWACDYYIPKHSYYADYIGQFEKIEGIIPLNKEQMQKRYAHYQFVHYKYKLRSVTLLNSFKMPIEQEGMKHINRPVKLSFQYNSNDKLEKVHHLDRNNTLISSFSSFNAETEMEPSVSNRKNKTRSYKLNTESDAGYTSGLSSRSSIKNPLVHRKRILDIRSEITKYIFTVDSLDQILQIDFYGRNEGPHNDMDGIAGLRYEYDKLKRIKKLTYLNTNHKPDTNQYGIKSILFEYDEFGNYSEIKFRNNANKPIVNSNGWAYAQYTSNEHGNIEKSCFLGVDKKPVIKLGGYASKTWCYDERGRRTSAHYYGKDEKPINNIGGYASRKWTYTYNPKSFHMRIQTSYFNKKGIARRHIDGYAKLEVVLNQNNTMVEQSYYNLDDSLTLYRYNYASVKLDLDSIGRPIRRTYLGIDSKSKKIQRGYASMEWKYDRKGNTISEAYYDENHNPCSLKDSKIVKWHSFYQGVRETKRYTGNIHAQAYFNQKGQLDTNAAGCYLVQLRYEPDGSLKNQECIKSPLVADSILVELYGFHSSEKKASKSILIRRQNL